VKFESLAKSDDLQLYLTPWKQKKPVQKFISQWVHLFSCPLVLSYFISSPTVMHQQTLIFDIVSYSKL